MVQANPILEVYPDNEAQFQNEADIGPQDPMPSDLVTLELSWDRNKGYMRIIIQDKGTWYFKELLGKAQLLYTDNQKGRLYLKAMPLLDGETLYLYRDPESEPHPMIDDNTIFETLAITNNRLCDNRHDV